MEGPLGKKRGSVLGCQAAGSGVRGVCEPVVQPPRLRCDPPQFPALGFWSQKEGPGLVELRHPLPLPLLPPPSSFRGDGSFREFPPPSSSSEWLLPFGSTGLLRLNFRKTERIVGGIAQHLQKVSK